MRRLMRAATRSGCSRATSRAGWPTTAPPSSSSSTALGVSISPSRFGKVIGSPCSSRVLMAENVVPRSMPTIPPASDMMCLEPCRRPRRVPPAPLRTPSRFYAAAAPGGRLRARRPRPPSLGAGHEIGDQVATALLILDDADAEGAAAVAAAHGAGEDGLVEVRGVRFAFDEGFLEPTAVTQAVDPVADGAVVLRRPLLA